MSKEKLTQIITAALSGKVSCATSARIVPIIVKCLVDSGVIKDDRQKAEIAELKSDLTLKTYDYEHLLMKCKEIQAISASRKDRLMQTVVKLQNAKAEVIKEFINELEKRLTHYGIYSQYVKDTIMQVAKEMTAKNDFKE